MSVASDLATEEVDTSIERGGWAPRRRRRILAGASVVVLIAVITVVATTDPFGSSGQAKGEVADNADPTSFATVTQRALSSQTQVNATLGYAGGYTLVNQVSGTALSSITAPATGANTPSGASQPSGTFTALPAVGQVVSQGQALYSVDGSPVVLLYGSTPSYRSLSEGMSGADVTELNADLVALGYATSSELDPTSDYFSSETAYALEQLQAALGANQSGRLTLGEAAFLPTSARVTAVSATLGAPAQVGASVLQATSTTREVIVDLDAAQQSEVAVGDKVTITLPNNQTTPGAVSSVGTVATCPPSSSAASGSSGTGACSSGSSGSSSTPTIAVDVTPSDPAATGSLDQAPVQVSITTASVNSALVVPVDALLALANGGYAIESVDAAGVHHLAPVTLGLFDDADGLVQITGTAVSPGQRVVVPAQ